jgi:hypothetical protein
VAAPEVFDLDLPFVELTVQFHHPTPLSSLSPTPLPLSYMPPLFSPPSIFPLLFTRVGRLFIIRFLIKEIFLMTVALESIHFFKAPKRGTTFCLGHNWQEK